MSVGMMIAGTALLNNRMFPVDDAADFGKGAKYIPGEVTDARREGKRVVFVQDDCKCPNCWYWLFVDEHKGIRSGARWYHFDSGYFQGLMMHYEVKQRPDGWYDIDLDAKYPCVVCGNTFMYGGSMGLIWEEDGILTRHPRPAPEEPKDNIFELLFPSLENS